MEGPCIHNMTTLSVPCWSDHSTLLILSQLCTVTPTYLGSGVGDVVSTSGA